MSNNAYPYGGLTEVARLAQQDEEMNRVIDYGSTGVIPIAPKPGEVIVDLGCGTGGWARTVADKYPKTQVLGLDKDPMLIERAQQEAITLPNVRFIKSTFEEMEKHLPQTIHVFHLRLLKWFLPEYDSFIQRCYSLLAPGGTLILVESEQQITNSLSWFTMTKHMGNVLARTQRNLLAEGLGSMGITLDMYHILKHAGFQDIKQCAFMMNFGYGVPGKEAYVLDLLYGFEGAIKWLKGAAASQGLSETELARFSRELDELAQQEIADLTINPDFRAITYFQSSYGRKPE